MGVLDALIFGYRTILRGDGVPMPQRSRVRFTGTTTDDPDNDATVVDPNAPVSTLLGDGDVGNPSHITGDRIVWVPTDVVGVSVAEISGRLNTAGAASVSVTVDTAVNLAAYKIDVEATVRRPDGYSEGWKLTFTASRVDSGPGLVKSSDHQDAHATDGNPVTLNLTSSLPGSNHLAVVFGGIAAASYDWGYTVRLWKHAALP